MFNVTITQNRRKRGARMHAGIFAAIVAAALLGPNAAWSACPPGQSPAGQPRGCLDLNLDPQVTQQVVAGERIATPPKTAPAAAPPPAYTGPTVGVSRT